MLLCCLIPSLHSPLSLNLVQLVPFNPHLLLLLFYLCNSSSAFLLHLPTSDHPPLQMWSAAVRGLGHNYSDLLKDLRTISTLSPEPPLPHSNEDVGLASKVVETQGQWGRCKEGRLWSG